MIYTSSNLYISYLNSFSIVIIKLLWNSIINYLTNTSVKPASKKWQYLIMKQNMYNNKMCSK